MKKFLLLTERKIDLFEKAVLLSLLFSMTFLSFLQFFLRFFFNSGLMWMDTFLRYLVLNTAMFSVAYVSQKGSHFALELLSKKVQGKSLIFFEKSAYFCAFLASSILFLSSLYFVKAEYESVSIAFSAFGLEVRAFILQLCMPISFFLSSFHFFNKMLLQTKTEQ